MQLLLDFSVSISYVLHTRLQKSEIQLLLDFSVKIRFVLPTGYRKLKCSHY